MSNHGDDGFGNIGLLSSSYNNNSNIDMNGIGTTDNGTANTNVVSGGGGMVGVGEPGNVPAGNVGAVGVGGGGGGGGSGGGGGGGGGGEESWVGPKGDSTSSTSTSTSCTPPDDDEADCCHPFRRQCCHLPPLYRHCYHRCSPDGRMSQAASSPIMSQLNATLSNVQYVVTHVQSPNEFQAFLMPPKDDGGVFIRLSKSETELRIIREARESNVSLFPELIMSVDSPELGGTILVEHLYPYSVQSVTPVPQSVTIHIIKSVAQALQFLHLRKIGHGNLKSSNILISEKWDVKVAGMSQAKLCEAAGEKRMKDDLYALGLILYHLILPKTTISFPVNPNQLYKESNKKVDLRICRVCSLLLASEKFRPSPGRLMADINSLSEPSEDQDAPHKPPVAPQDHHFYFPLPNFGSTTTNAYCHNNNAANAAKKLRSNPPPPLIVHKPDSEYL